MKKLDDRIVSLKAKGINVNEEVQTLKALHNRITPVCTDLTYLDNYKRMLETEGYFTHASRNKLRDVPDQYVEHDHVFSLNRNILGTFDICGNCESHALLFSVVDGVILFQRWLA